MSEVDIDEKSLEAIKNVMEQLKSTSSELGMVYLQKREVENNLKQLEEMENTYIKEIKRLRNLRERVVNEIQEKYGTGVLDIDKGHLVIEEE